MAMSILLAGKILATNPTTEQIRDFVKQKTLNHATGPFPLDSCHNDVPKLYKNVRFYWI